MDDDGFCERAAFVRMAREFPLRTCIFTFGLPVFALLQLINGFLHGGPLHYIAGFSVLAVGCSVMLTRCHVAAYRRQRLVSRWS